MLGGLVMTDKLKIAIENHRKMWEFVKSKEDAGDSGAWNREDLKYTYIRDNTKDFPLNRCYLCDYAIDMQEDKPMCEYCPCLWGSEGKQAGFYCQSKDGGIDWRTSSAEDIINIPIKPELL